MLMLLAFFPLFRHSPARRNHIDGGEEDGCMLSMALRGLPSPLTSLLFSTRPLREALQCRCAL